jgi:hypothetical protein
MYLCFPDLGCCLVLSGWVSFLASPLMLRWAENPVLPWQQHEVIRYSGEGRQSWWCVCVAFWKLWSLQK